MGKAVIDEQRCLDFIYARAEESGENDGTALYCNICVNSCPLTGKAIILENLLTPKITEFCNGCGVCVERCPTEPKSVSILPTGLAVLSSMENKEDIIFKADFNTENIVEEWYGSGDK
jgi:ferredoxin-type protein NapG